MCTVPWAPLRSVFFPFYAHSRPHNALCTVGYLVNLPQHHPTCYLKKEMVKVKGEGHPSSIKAGLDLSSLMVYPWFHELTNSLHPIPSIILWHAYNWYHVKWNLLICDIQKSEGQSTIVDNSKGSYDTFPLSIKTSSTSFTTIQTKRALEPDQGLNVASTDSPTPLARTSVRKDLLEGLLLRRRPEPSRPIFDTNSLSQWYSFLLDSQERMDHQLYQNEEVSKHVVFYETWYNVQTNVSHNGPLQMRADTDADMRLDKDHVKSR